MGSEMCIRDSFEQAVVTIGDAIFHARWKASGLTADELWPRHSNLE